MNNTSMKALLVLVNLLGVSCQDQPSYGGPQSCAELLTQTGLESGAIAFNNYSAWVSDCG
ncbi:hypothetical protein Slin15195_G120730 [Septoria linicola]|uniref:Uncharacterized protein n=1 Tax=Septoria linicola TaxID=215465 RepID=A0A9Q9EQG9_9PEZI|nr:hypothetical protein Slin15195_G120730 [Septoria linicola]